ncbi:CaiB/BaiF CoA transferase family protein [Chloroflexota bacterium]
MLEGALSDISVIELGSMISVPFCAKLMADLGAEVIKIESPLKGDPSRQSGPFPKDIPDQEKSGLFLYLNANKWGITLDINHQEGQSLLYQLLRSADVLIHDLPPEHADDLHLNYDYLKDLNSAVVVCAISPYGVTGPYRSFKGTPLTVSHMSGAASTVGESEREPLALPEDRSDYFAATAAAGAILCALFARDLDGHGQDVDIAQVDVLSSMLMGGSVARSHAAGERVPRMGHRVVLIYPSVTLPCKDGYVSLMALEDAQWQRLVEAMGSPDWAQSDLFQTRRSRSTVADALEELLIDWARVHTKEEIFQLCQSNRVPAAPFYTPEEIVAHPHLAERGFFQEMEHPVAGNLIYPGAPYLLSKSPWALRHPAPMLGEHNQEVYCGRMGIPLQELALMRSQGVI